MHRPLIPVPALWGGLLLLFSLLSLPAVAAPAAAGEPLYRDGELLVRFSPEARAARMSLHAAGGLQLQRRLARDVELVRLPPGLSVEEALERYRADPLVEHVEPNRLVRRAASTGFEQRFDEQWYLERIGAQKAWAIGGTGSRQVVVAVLDSGIDYEHPDLKANIWENPAPKTADECAAADGPEPCYVDDVRGWNFVGAWDPKLGKRVPNNDPMDDDADSHGTHVAGLIGAAGVSIYGVSPRVSLMPLKFLDRNGAGSIADLVAAIDYAVANGADIINASVTIPSTRCEKVHSQFAFEAVANAAKKNVLIVAAAGNAGCDNDLTPFYPASLPLPNVIAVAASDANDRLASFSNYGSGSVHLAAPGTAILSTVHRDQATDGGGPYATMSGTSMAAPLVSGALALLKTHCTGLDWRQRRELLLQSAVPVELKGKLLTGGRLDVEAALICDLSGFEPLPPNHLRGRRLSVHEIELEWVANSLPSKPYRLERRRPGGHFELVGQPAADAVLFNDTRDLDARPGTRWEYRLQAANEYGESWSTTASVAVPLPPPPELRAWFDEGRGVRLSWRYDEPLHDGFEIQRAAAGGSWDVIAEVRDPGYLDAGLVATGEYRYRVRALGTEVGPSSPSGTAAVSVTSLGFGGGRSDRCVLTRLLAGSPRGDAMLASLRSVRDQYLQPNPVGRYVVRAYYRLGTPLVEWLDRRAGGGLSGRS